LKQPVTAEFVSGKFYSYFVREDVPASGPASLARTFRESGYQIKPLLKQIFLSRDFYSPPAHATQVKSPVQLVVSTYKKLGLREVPTIPDFGRMTPGLGQSLFDRPNVAGWDGGRTWITPSTLLQRGNPFREVLFPNVKGFRPPDRSLSATDRGVGERLAQGMDITEATKESDAAPNMMAESNMMVDRDEDYNTRYGGYKGNLLAFERTKTIPRHPATIDLTAMTRAAGADTVDKVVDHFVHRFLSVALADKDRAVIRPGLLPRQAKARDQGSQRAQSRRGVRLSSLDGRFRAAVQGRDARRRTRLRVRSSEPVAFLVDGFLAHGCPQWRRVARMARPAGRPDLRHEDAQHDRGSRQLTVARRPQRASFAARV